MSEKSAKTPAKADKAEKVEKTESVSGMNDGDLKFMAECFRNSNGALAIDIEAVAEALGLKNPRSVSNRLSAIRKKYGLNINTTTASKGATAATTGGIIGNDKVTKPRTPRTPRNKDTPKKLTSGRSRKEETTPTKTIRKAPVEEEDDDMVDAQDNVKDEDDMEDEDAGAEFITESGHHSMLMGEGPDDEEEED